MKQTNSNSTSRFIKTLIVVDYYNRKFERKFHYGRIIKTTQYGKEVERHLNEVGIFTFDELKEIGAEQPWLKIQEIDASACIHRLLALEGAINGIKKTTLPQERRI